MFKEIRFIYQEMPSMGVSPRKAQRNRIYKGAEVSKEVQEKEKKQKEDSVKVAEKMISNLEQFGIKCEMCGSKNTREYKHDDLKIYMECLDCKFKWEEDK